MVLVFQEFKSQILVIVLSSQYSFSIFLPLFPAVKQLLLKVDLIVSGFFFKRIEFLFPISADPTSSIKF